MKAVKKPAEKLVKDGILLEEDADRRVSAAEASDVLSKWGRFTVRMNVRDSPGVRAFFTP